MADKRFSNGREYEINFDEKATVTQTVDDNSVKQVNYMFHKVRRRCYRMLLLLGLCSCDIASQSQSECHSGLPPGHYHRHHHRHGRASASLSSPIPCVQIATMGDLEADRIVDVVGILTSVKEPADIHTKSGKDLVKREIVLADDSGASIECTIWGDKARLPYSEGQILAIKGAKISNWNGKSLGTQNSSTITVDPDLPEAHSMRGWYSSTGGAGITENLSVRGERGGAGGEGGGMASGLTDASLRYTVEGLQQGSLGAGDGTLCHVKVGNEGGEFRADFADHPPLSSAAGPHPSQSCIVTGSLLSFLLSATSQATMKYIRNEVDKLAYPACK